MPKFTLLIYADPSEIPAQDSPEGQAEFGAWMQVSQELAESGALVAGEALEPIPTATTVRGGGDVVTDGPFAETKEHLGGFYLVEADDIDGALAWAKRMPHLGYGSVEVRPVMEFPEA